jgi:hypothetical protein
MSAVRCTSGCNGSGLRDQVLLAGGAIVDARHARLGLCGGVQLEHLGQAADDRTKRLDARVPALDAVEP